MRCSGSWLRSFFTPSRETRSRGSSTPLAHTFRTHAYRVEKHHRPLVRASTFRSAPCLERLTEPKKILSVKTYGSTHNLPLCPGFPSLSFLKSASSPFGGRIRVAPGHFHAVPLGTARRGDCGKRNRSAEAKSGVLATSLWGQQVKLTT